MAVAMQTGSAPNQGMDDMDIDIDMDMDDNGPVIDEDFLLEV
jgi:hypothetical protein